jgi:hypothetical protein
MAETNAAWQDGDQDFEDLCRRHREALYNDPRLKAMILYREELVHCLIAEHLMDYMPPLLSDGRFD